MFLNVKSKFDSFAFALGGAAIVGPFAPVPVLLSESINEAWDRRLAGPRRADPVPSSGEGLSVLAAECS